MGIPQGPPHRTLCCGPAQVCRYGLLFTAPLRQGGSPSRLGQSSRAHRGLRQPYRNAKNPPATRGRGVLGGVIAELWTPATAVRLSGSDPTASSAPAGRCVRSGVPCGRARPRCPVRRSRCPSSGTSRTWGRNGTCRAHIVTRSANPIALSVHGNSLSRVRIPRGTAHIVPLRTVQQFRRRALFARHYGIDCIYHWGAACANRNN